MGVIESIESWCLPADKRSHRLSQLVITLTVAATAVIVAAASMTRLYGYPDYAFLLLLGAFTLPVALLVLRWANANAAGHYLVGNLLVQAIFFAAEPAVGCVTMIAIAAGAALLGKKGEPIWLGLIVAYCLYITFAASSILESATAGVAALIASVAYLLVRISERSRRLSSLKERQHSRKYSAQISVLQKFAEKVFDGHLLLEDGLITGASNKVPNLLGYPRDALIGQRIDNYLHPEEQAITQHLDLIQAPERLEMRVRHADGRWVWVEAYTSPELIRDNPKGLIIALRNYENQRRVSQQLTQVQRLESMGTMAAAVSHDLANMLTVILGQADELPASAHRDDIIRTATNAAAITQQLRSFGTGQRSTSEVHDLSYLMRELSPLVQHGLDSRFILIEGYAEEPALVRIGEAEFEQVLVNLVNNAREAMPEGGEIEVSLQSEELERHGEINTYAVLEVRDTGTGMDAQTQSRVFDPFFSTKDGQRNSGLGLSSSYSIVSRYGGVIELDSEIGVGTTMRVLLPIAETRDHEPVLEVIQNQPMIMLVDDDPGVLKVMKNALTRAGYITCGFTNAKAAYEYYSPNRIALLVSDIMMTGMSGSELAEQLRQQTPNLPVLFVSGYPSESLTDWRNDPQTAYLAKPFRSEEVVTRVDALLRSYPTRAVGAR